MNTKTLIKSAREAEAVGNIARAVELCNQALFISPDCVDALLILGSFAARRGRVAEAIALLRRALSNEPECYDAAKWLTTLLIGRDSGYEAVTFGQIAVRLRPAEAEPYIVLGLAAMGCGDSALAIENLQHAIELNPRISGAYHNLGVAFQREDSIEEAIDAFQKALKFSPAVLESHLHLGRCYLAASRGDDALKCAQKALDLAPNSKLARVLLADASFSAALGERGIEHIRKAIDRDPTAGFPHALLGSRLQEQGEFGDAAKSIEQSIELQPEQGFAYYLFAHNRRISEEDRTFVERADIMSREVQLMTEESQYLHFGLGKAFDDLGDYERAIRHFDMAHEQPDRPDTQPVALEVQARRINRFKEVFSNEFLDEYAHLSLESREPIFIFGMPRSGTTLLEQIVSRHSTVGGGGELFFWRDHCRRIVNLKEGAINERQANLVGKKYLEFIRTRVPGKAHVTDKFPSNYVYLGLLRLLYPNARFIHARRNPIDTCLSIYMRPFVTNQGLGRTRRQIVESYKMYRQAMAHWRRLLGPDVLIEVDYEQLVQNPEPVIRRVIQSCGLDWEDGCLSPQEGDRRVLTFSMWQVRQPVYTSSVERWRRYEPWIDVFRELEDLPPI